MFMTNISLAYYLLTIPTLLMALRKSTNNIPDDIKPVTLVIL